MNQYLSSDTVKLIIASVSFIALLILLFFLYRYSVFNFEKKGIPNSRES